METETKEKDFPFLFSIDSDIEKQEITITLPLGENQLILSKDWVRCFIDCLEDRAREW